MSQPHEISPLTLALAAGGFAIGGVVVGQIFGLLSGWIDRQHQKRIRKIRRLEKIVELSTESVAWVRNLSASRSLSDFRAAQPPLLLRDIVLLARLSFPNLVTPSSDYADSCVAYYQLVWECYDQNIPASVGAQLAVAVATRPEIAKRESEFHNARHRLDDALVAESARLKDQ